jgi:hypothetical protein
VSIEFSVSRRTSGDTGVLAPDADDDPPTGVPTPGIAISGFTVTTVVGDAGTELPPFPPFPPLSVRSPSLLLLLLSRCDRRSGMRLGRPSAPVTKMPLPLQHLRRTNVSSQYA